MKTLDEIKQRGSNALDGRDFRRLGRFIPEGELGAFGLALIPELVGTHKAKPFTREAVLDQLEKDVAFGFEKALDKRGLSAGMMAEVVQMWNWILQEGLEDFDEYPQYGLPIFKATAIKYGFPNPIGNYAGNEPQYASE